MENRELVFAAINAEREKQIEKWGEECYNEFYESIGCAVLFLGHAMAVLVGGN